MDGINRYFEPNRLDGLSIYSTPEALLVDGTNQMLADANLGGHNIKNLATAVNPDEAVNLGQVNTALALKADNSTVVHITGNESIAGNKTFTDKLIRGANSYNAGEYVQSQFGPFNVDSFSINGDQGFTNIGSKTVSVKTTNAKLHIMVDMSYYITGSNSDQVKARLRTNTGSILAVTYQNYGGSSGSGTRSNTLFPLVGSTTTTSSSFTFYVDISTTYLSSSDRWGFDLNVESDGPAKNFYRVDEFKV